MAILKRLTHRDAARLAALSRDAEETTTLQFFREVTNLVQLMGMPALARAAAEAWRSRPEPIDGFIDEHLCSVGLVRVSERGEASLTATGRAFIAAVSDHTLEVDQS